MPSGTMLWLRSTKNSASRYRLLRLKKDKADRSRKIEVFLHMMEEQEECIVFDPYTFVALVDKVVIGQDGQLEFIFRNGMKYEY